MLGLLTSLALMSAPALPPSCTAGMLRLSLDAGDGEFNGMSHSGTRVILHNTGDTTCRLPGHPAVTFKGKVGVLPMSSSVRETYAPVAPVLLAAGKSASMTLRWVSGEVYEHSRCVEPQRIELRWERATTIGADFSGHMCGEGRKPINVEQSDLALSP